MKNRPWNTLYKFQEKMELTKEKSEWIKMYDFS